MAICDDRSLDFACNYHVIKSVKAPKPPVTCMVTFSKRIKDESIHDSILKKIQGRTMYVPVYRFAGVVYAYVPGAFIEQEFFVIRRKR